MRLSFVSQSVSTLLVVAIASVAAKPSTYAVPSTLRGDPPSLMVENYPEGTLPLVYGLGISKNPRRIGIPGTLQARAPTCNTGYVATCPPTEDNCCPEAYPVCCPNPATVCCHTGSFCVGLKTCCTATQTACGEGCCDAGKVCCGGTCCDTGYTCSASGTCTAGTSSTSSSSSSAPNPTQPTQSQPPASASSTQAGGGVIGNNSGSSATSSRTTSRSSSGTIAGATDTSTPEAKNNTGAIVGGVVGGVAIVIILVGLLLFMLHKQKKKKQLAAASEGASTYTQQPMMGQASPYSPGFAGAGAAGVGAGAMAAGAPGSPGPAHSNYYGGGGPSSGAPTPALVYNQGEQYPANSFQQNYAQNNNAYGGGVDQYGRPLSAASGGAAPAPLPMWVQRASNAPGSNGYPEAQGQGYAPPPGPPQQHYGNY